MGDVPAHDQKITHSYIVHFPNHSPRADDPHYAAFEAFKKRTHATAVCAIGEHLQDYSTCSLDQPLEVHHSIIEFAVANEVDLHALAEDFPDVLDDAALQRFIESDRNFMWLCVAHHRGRAGAHTASYADWEAGKYVKGLIS